MGRSLDVAVTVQVTALGIRDGDPAVLRALVDRRGFAVLAFCERACPPGTATDAAADAFARFRAMVQVADRPAQLDPEAALLSATRHASATQMPRPAAAAPSALGRLLGSRGSGAGDDVAGLLARRADGLLDAAGEERLAGLLDASPDARAVEQRLRAAEHAYLTARPRHVPADVIDHIVDTMAGRPRFAAEPAEPAEVNGAEPDPPPEPAEDEGRRSGFFAGAFALSGVEEEAAAATRPPADGPVEAVEAVGVEQDAPADEVDAAPVEVPAAVDEAEPEPVEEALAVEPQAEDPVEAGPAELDPQLTEEWSLPADDGDHVDEDATHLQSASGAVDEPLVGEDRPDDDDDAVPTSGPVIAAAGETPSRGLPRLPTERHPLPARGALIPAGAVVTIAAIGALAASGVFGGSDPAPPVDTGIVPPRALQAVPEGETAEVIDDLRSSASDARRRRLADRRLALAAAQLRPEPDPEPAPEEDAAPDTDAPAPDADADAGAGGGTAGGAGQAPQDEAPAAPADEPGTGGTADEPTITGEVGGDAAP